MATRRVFVLWTHALFYDSLRLLLNQPGIEVVGTTSDNLAARDQIAGLQPDTVLVEEDEGENGPEEILRMLEASPAGMRIIRLSRADNELKVYHREKRIVGKADDLLRLIQNEQ